MLGYQEGIWNTTFLTICEVPVLPLPAFSFIMQDMPCVSGPYHKSFDVVRVTISSIG